MTRTAQYLLAIVLCAVMPALPSSAKSSDGPKKHRHDVAAVSDRGTDAREEEWERDPVAFSARDRDAIRLYYRGAISELSPGPVRRMRLQRNGLLPPGLQRRLEPLPDDLERRLQPLYSGYARGVIGQDVVIVESRTQRIMDIIRNVTTHR